MRKLLLAAAAALGTLAIPAGSAAAQPVHWSGAQAEFRAQVHLAGHDRHWDRRHWRDPRRDRRGHWRDPRWHRPPPPPAWYWQGHWRPPPPPPRRGWVAPAACRTWWWDGWAWRCRW